MAQNINLNNTSDYEQSEFKEIVAWQNAEPSVVTKAIGLAMKPVTWVVNKVIPQKAIRGALIAANGAAEWLTDKNDILRDGEVTSIEELRSKNLQLSDKLANNVHNWALAVTGAEGLAAGATGLPGLIVDVPVLITLSLRTIHKIGLCYGYQCTTETDKQLVYGILSAAGANTVEEKAVSVAMLQRISVMVSKTTWKALAEKAATSKYGMEAVIISVKGLAKQLGVNLTKRKALQAIPIVGAGVAASMNVAFLTDVAWAARRVFQAKWLRENGKIIDV